MDLNEHLPAALSHVLHAARSHFERVPGSAILLRYIKSSYQNDPARSVFELLLLLFALRYLLAPKYSSQRGKLVVLDEDEVDELVEDWVPEPLVAPPTEWEERMGASVPVIVGPTGPKSRLASGQTVTNLASLNFYNFIASEDLKQKAIGVLRNYGVGPCSPPNFYGTQDVHKQTEADVAAHLGTAACIIYAQAFSTISSAIPAFSKRGDIIVADEAVNYTIQKGIQISRSTVKWYKHNDMEDLERVLANVTKEQLKKPLTRRFIVTEGMFENVGDIVDLRRVIELKHRYKFRLILDETSSYGVLGASGRGVTEQQSVDPTTIDLLIGSLAGPLCGGGGFCAGSPEVVEHQRISAAAYCFSAALPAILATTASETIAIVQQSPTLLAKLRRNIDVMRASLFPSSSKNNENEYVRCTSAPENPIVFLALRESLIATHRWSREDQDWIFQEVVDACLERGVLITTLKAMPVPLGPAPKKQPWQPAAGLKICLTTGLEEGEVESAGRVISGAVEAVVGRWAGR